VALLHLVRYQQSLRRYHARGVWPRDFQVGDLVLRLRQDARGRHKLTPPWEGPFIIAKILKPDSYVAFTLKMFSSRSYTSFSIHTKIKSNRQGRVSLASAKPDPPLGARRGEPPLRQNFPRKSFPTKTTFVLSDYIDNRILQNE
jgi:hypothetical protein